MKVAIVVNTLKIGGMERVAVNLSEAFLSSGHKAHLIYLKNKRVEIEITNSNLPVHLFDLKKKVFSTGIGIAWYALCKFINIFVSKLFPILFAYVEAKAFQKELQQLETVDGEPFDLVIFRGQGTFEHIWPLQDPRFVFVCENVQVPLNYGNLSSWVFNNLFSNRNVSCVSNGALVSFNELTEQYGIRPDKAVMINNPNDIDGILTKTSSLKLHNKPYILGLGRVVPQKNFILLIQAFNYAIENCFIEHDSIIVGDGSDRASVEAEVDRLGITDRVFFKGKQINPFPWYEQAELFVLSSKHEGLGMVLIEALACKTKVVSTDSRGGVRQIMNGQLEKFLAKETPESLGKKIHFALSYDWNNSFDSFISMKLNEFSGPNIVDAFIKEFRIS